VVLDAGTFVVAAGAVAALRMREPAPAPSGAHWRAEVTAGIRYVSRTPALRRLLVTGVIALLVFGFFETVPYSLVSQGLRRAPAFLGVLEAVLGAGALAGGVVAAPIMRRTSERARLTLALLIAGGACLLLIPARLPAVLAAMGVLGLAIVWFNVGANTLIQRRTPAGLIGRVDAALTIALTVPQTVSIALGAALVAVVDYRVLLAVMAVVIVISAVYLAAEHGGGQDTAGPVVAGPAAAAAAPAAEPVPVSGQW
jgi:MFS family permease